MHVLHHLEEVKNFNLGLNFVISIVYLKKKTQMSLKMSEIKQFQGYFLLPYRVYF